LDHVDIYRSQQEYLGAFERLIERLPADGLLVACEEDRHARGLARRARCRVVTYGVDAGDYRAKRASWGETASLDLVRRRRVLTHVEAPLFGRHNVQNLVGASALVIESGLVGAADVADAALKVTLPRRRLVDHGNLLFEDIASSPTKMAASLAALSDRFIDQELIVVFEPYSRTWRHPLVLPQLGDAFSRADLVVLSRPRPIGRATGIVESPVEDVMAALRQAGIATVEVDGAGTLEGVLRVHLRGGEVILLATSGEAASLLAPIRAAMKSGAVA
jgi:UDP-N-acetylmuramate: L-alanyl-gamma-D-glutamyl-meso-diaminopimelate ligase